MPNARSLKHESTRGKMLLYDRISHLIWISIFAYLGVLIRVALTFLSSIPTESLLPKLGASFFLPNIFGSFLMGCLGPLADIFKPWAAVYVGLSTGFCGSCTTFATWQLVAAAQILNGGWLDSIIQSLVTFCTSYMALLAGKHFGYYLKTQMEQLFHPQPEPQTEIPLTTKPSGNGQLAVKLPQTSGEDPTENPERKRTASIRVPTYVPSTKAFLSLISIFLLITILIWVGIFLDTAHYRCQWWVAVAFGPLGAISRYFLSLYNPAYYPNFPAFTFIANTLGTVLNIVILMLDNHFEGYNHALSAQGIQLSTSQFNLAARKTFKFWVRFGLSTGLMGSLSTVSTWVNEIWNLASKKPSFAYRYAIISLVVAQLLCLLIGGIWILTGNKLIL